MFEVEIMGQPMKVVFRHSNPRDKKPSGILYGTKCLIFKKVPELNDKPPIFIGSTSLHPSDYNKYDKEFGRKMSLKRAIWALGKEERTKIWKAYFEAKERK